MWKLEIHQTKKITLPPTQVGENIIREEKPFETEQIVEFFDENVNNLLDLVRYLNECDTPERTWYNLENLDKKDNIPTTIYKQGV
jgi:hypothetical protein